MLHIILLAAVFVLTWLCGIFAMPRIVRMARGLHLYDLPDSRKVHQLPIPRLGGVAFLPTVVVVACASVVMVSRMGSSLETLWRGSYVVYFLAYLAGVIPLYAIGLYDDIRGIGYKAKFAVQIASGVILCVSGLWMASFNGILWFETAPWWIGMPATVVMVVYVTNAMNLIDGIDGLASGLSCISLCVITLISILIEDWAWALLAVGYLGVVASFFYFNVFASNNKVFMGDAGSLTIGFTLSFLMLHFLQVNGEGLPTRGNTGIVVLSTLIIPMFDVVRVFLSRLRDKRNPFLPDKNHIHHKLLRTGLSAHWTMAMLLLLTLAFIAVNYAMARTWSTKLLIIGADIMLYVIMHWIINYFIVRREHRKGIVYNRQL